MGGVRDWDGRSLDGRWPEPRTGGSPCQFFRYPSPYLYPLHTLDSGSRRVKGLEVLFWND